jgi:hypothetical protein
MDESRTSSSRTRDGVAVCRSVRFGVRHGADRPLPEVRRHRFDQIGPRRRRGAEKRGSTVPRSRPTPAPSDLESPRTIITLACSSRLRAVVGSIPTRVAPARLGIGGPAIAGGVDESLADRGPTRGCHPGACVVPSPSTRGVI